MVQTFLSRDPARMTVQMAIVEEAVRYHNQKVIGWRDVPVRTRSVGNRPCSRERAAPS